MKVPILTAVMLMVVLVGSNRAQGPGTEAQKANASISGIVTQQGTGLPLPGAQITLTRGRPAQVGGGLNSPATGGPGAPTQGLPFGDAERGARAIAPPAPIPPVSTDEEGRFLISDLDEGVFTLQVRANGHVPLTYGQRYANGPGGQITLTPGQEMKGLGLALTPGGNITGRVFDTTDQPLINVPVRLFREIYGNNGQRTYQPDASATTNDRGEYRIYWLTPGRYYAMAGSPSNGQPNTTVTGPGLLSNSNPNILPSQLNYSIYPGVTDIASARPLDVQAGADLDGVHFRLARKPVTFGVRVRVIDARTGQPPAVANLTIAPQGMFAIASDPILREFGNVPNAMASTGISEFKDLLPGIYTIRGQGQDARPAAGTGRGNSVITRLSGTATVVVSDKDADATLTMSPPISIAGKVRVEGSLPAPLTLERIRLQLRQVEGNMPTAAPAADGSITFNNIQAGDYRPFIGGTRTDIYIKEARFEGGDVLNTPMRVSGAVSGALDIVIGVGGGQIRGVVTDERSQPVPVIQVVLVPDRRHRVDLYRNIPADDDGQFTFTGIPPGDYKVFSWDAVETYQWMNPEFVEPHETKGRGVQVTEGSSENISVRVISVGGAQ